MIITISHPRKSNGGDISSKYGAGLDEAWGHWTGGGGLVRYEQYLH